MSKFTQGKWRCEYNDNKYIFGSKDEVIGELYFITLIVGRVRGVTGLYI